MNRIYSFSCESFMADRMGLHGTTLHYLAVHQAMVSVHGPVHSKIALTYSGAFPDKLTAVHPQRMAFKALLNAQGSPLLASFPYLFCQNGLVQKHGWLCALSITQLHEWAHQRSAYTHYLLSALYITHVINYSRPSTGFLYCK